MLNLLAIDLQQAFMQAETWIVAFFAWLGSSSVAAVIIGVIARILTKKVNRQTNVSKKEIENASDLSAERAVKKMVGKSFNVNIKSEVDSAVKAELKPIRETAEYASVAARNAEIASAHVLLAQSRSRLLNEEEQANLQLIAKKILAHASGDVVSPTVIEITEEENIVPKTQLEADKKTIEENSSLVSFDDIN